MSYFTTLAKIPNQIAPDRAGQNDHYDMRIDNLDKRCTLSFGLGDDVASTAVTGVAVETQFDKTLTIPHGTLVPGWLGHTKAIVQITAGAGATGVFKLKIKNLATGAVTVLATSAAITPAAAPANDTVVIDFFHQLDGGKIKFNIPPGGSVYQASNVTSTAIAAVAGLVAINPLVDQQLLVTVTPSAADATSFVLTNLSFRHE